MKWLGVIFVFTLMLTAVTCRLPEDPFEVYRGVNLISGISLADWVLDDDTGLYMSYEDVSDTEDPPPDYSGASVYHLVIKSLIPNGKFDAGVGAWTLQELGGGPDTLDFVDDPNPYEINGKTMHFATDHPDDRVEFDITDSGNGAVDGFIADSSYLIRYDYRAKSSLVFEYNDTADPFGYWKIFGGEDGEASDFEQFEFIVDFPPEKLEGPFPEVTAGSELTYLYIFGSLVQVDSQPQEGYIDNFRLIRTDIPYKIRLFLRRSGDTEEPLLSGTYRFSVSVKSETALVVTDRYLAESLTLGIAGGTGIARSTRYQDYHKEGGWTDWTVVYTDLFIQIPEDAGDEELIELSICASDDAHGSLNLDTGSLFISSPRLTFHPEGTPE